MAAARNDKKMHGNANDSQHDTVINVSDEVSMASLQTVTEISITRKHVLVVGPVGAGKTNLIKILTNNASINSTGRRLSVEPTKKVGVVARVYDNVEYVFIDTPGFGGLTIDGEDDANNPLSKLFVYLASKQTRFDCVLFVWKRGRIDRTFSQSYSLLRNKLIKQSTPFILVVTGCELEEDIESITDSTRKELTNMNFARIVCGTTLEGGRLEEQYRDVREPMCRDLWQNITELSAKRLQTIEDALEDATSETETFFLVRWVIAAWEILQNVVSYSTEKVADVFTYVLVNMDLSTQDVRQPVPEPSNTNRQTQNIRDFVQSNIRPD